jgi:hypothetical protein
MPLLSLKLFPQMTLHHLKLFSVAFISIQFKAAKNIFASVAPLRI